MWLYPHSYVCCYKVCINFLYAYISISAWIGGGRVVVGGSDGGTESGGEGMVGEGGSE